MEGNNSGGSSHGLGSKTWFSRRLRSSKRSTEDHSSAHKSSPTIPDASFTDLPTLYPSDSRSFSEQGDNARQLHLLVQKMRSAPTGPNHVDAAYKEISKMFEKASGLCSAVLQDELKPLQRYMSNATQTQASPRDHSVEPRSPITQLDSRSSFSGRSLAEVVSGAGGTRSLPFASDAWLSPLRDWKNCVETVGEAFRANLAETYMSYEKDATPEMLESLFTSKKFRREAVHRMRNASVTRVLSANPEFFPKYEIRFRNYEKLKLELGNIRQMLQLGESGISPSRTILEYQVAPRGDAVLEFANLHPDANGDEAVLRFRVSPHVLAETSPIFARMFSGHGYSLHVHDSEDITSHLPSPPSRYYCSDGTEAWLYRMPQLETNQHQAMEILMHAAHMHNTHVPREVTFDQFVAIAQCSIQYKSTSPLELMVEHRWLPQWMHKGADDMPDGLLIISYAFGARGLFTRTSKSALLNLLDEKDLNSKPWPQKIKDKIWAVRNAKVAQLYNCCTAMLQEYLPPPTCEPTIEPDLTSPAAGARTGINAALPPKTSMPMVSTPRCPKGSHWCDAANLGWLMLVFNNMGIMDSVLKSSTLHTMPEPPFQSKSLVQIVDLLRSIPPAIAPVHRGGVCDPIPAFRTMIADIYNTVNGLTLHDVSGKSHGWALSKNMTTEPQIGEAIGLARMAAPDNSYSVAAEFPEKVLFKILCEISDLQDLHSAARVNSAFYETYKTHELHLIRHILRVGRVRSGSLIPRLPMHASNAEDKSLLSDLNEHPPEVDDAPTAATSDAESTSDGSDDELPIDTTRFSTVQQPPEYQTMDSSPVGSIRRPEQAESDDDDTASEGGHQDETPEAEPMTEEEAFRIIWPEGYDNPIVTPNTPTVAAREGLREKFRVNDQSFIDGLEDKTLLPVEGKRMHQETLASRARHATSGSSRA